MLLDPARLIAKGVNPTVHLRFVSRASNLPGLISVKTAIWYRGGGQFL